MKNDMSTLSRSNWNLDRGLFIKRPIFLWISIVTSVLAAAAWVIQDHWQELFSWLQVTRKSWFTQYLKLITHGINSVCQCYHSVRDYFGVIVVFQVLKNEKQKKKETLSKYRT